MAVTRSTIARTCAETGARTLVTMLSLNGFEIEKSRLDKVAADVVARLESVGLLNPDVFVEAMIVRLGEALQTPPRDFLREHYATAVGRHNMRNRDRAAAPPPPTKAAIAALLRRHAPGSLTLPEITKHFGLKGKPKDELALFLRDLNATVKASRCAHGTVFLTLRSTAPPSLGRDADDESSSSPAVDGDATADEHDDVVITGTRTAEERNREGYAGAIVLD